MGRVLKIAVFGLLLMASLSTAWATESIRIGLPEAYLLDGPGTDYKLLCKVTKDEPLDLLSWEGDWFRVRKPNGVIGWISRVVLSPGDSARFPGGPRSGDTAGAKPSHNTTSGPSFLDSIRTGFSGNRDDSITASAGGRGIATEDGSGGSTRDYMAVEYMESVVISDGELYDFIVSGGLKP